MGHVPPRRSFLGGNWKLLPTCCAPPPRRHEKVEAAFEAIHRKARTTSLRKWCKWCKGCMWRNLLGLLHSTTPVIYGSRGMFTRVQHALKRVEGRHVQLTTDVHDELEDWRELICSLGSSPTHLRELEPFTPTWIGTTDAPGSGMGGVCRDPEGQYFVWRSPFSLTTQTRLLYYSNHTGYVTTNELKLGALIMQILIFPPRMAPLVHIHTYVNNMAAQGWSNRDSASTASFVGTILRELSLAVRRQHIHASVVRVPEEDNKMADAASRLNHLPDQIFFSLPHTQTTEQVLASNLPAIRVQSAANYNAAQQAINQGFSATIFKKDATV